MSTDNNSHDGSPSEMQSSDDFQNIINSEQPEDASANVNKLLWKKHGAYKLFLNIKLFLAGPKRPKTSPSQFKFIAERIISGDISELVLKSATQLLEQHRTVEDTQARRRLERWACKSIVIYLLCTLMLVIANGISQIIWPDIFKEHGFISDTVMTVILSTTTVNIIGLGVIVLKGHFPNRSQNQNN